MVTADAPACRAVTMPVAPVVAPGRPVAFAIGRLTADTPSWSSPAPPFGMVTADAPACRAVTMPTAARPSHHCPQMRPRPWRPDSTTWTVHAMTSTSSLGLRSCGVWTRADALAVLSRGQVDALVRARWWQVPWRGVYADGGHELDPEQRAWAAVLAAGGAVVEATGPRLRAVAAGRTAARVWGLPLIDDLDPATGSAEHVLDEVAVARRLPRQHWQGRELRPIRTDVSPAELMQLPSGLWVTSPLRTLVDCAGLLAADALVCAVDAALHRHLVSTQDLAEAVRTRARLPHKLALQSAVGRADARAESPPETLARLLLQPSLPGFEPQVELHDDAGRTVARFDLGDPAVRLAVECDGVGAHAGARMVAKDRRRDRRTEAYRWRTERVTWFELRREQAAFLSRVTEAHAALAAAEHDRAA